MMNQTSIIVNEYAGIIGRIIDRPVVRIDGSFMESEFEREVAPLFKQQYLDMVILDATTLKEKVLEAARYLKINLAPSVRLIVVYPNLEDEAIYQQLLVYGIYDVVKPKINKHEMSDGEIEKKITAEINWAISEPTPFSKVADKLAISVITQNIVAPAYEPEHPKAKKSNKPRLMGFYRESDDAFEAIRESGRYNIVGIYSEFERGVDYDFSAVDIIVMDEPDADFASYIRGLADVNETKTIVLAGYSSKAEADASTIKGVRCFEYDGSSAHFARQVSVVAGRKEEVAINPNHRIYAFYGVKGGVGTSTIAALVAEQYLKDHPEHKAVIVDFSAQAGDLGEKFGIEKPDPNLFECIATFVKAKQEHLDIDLLKEKIVGYCHYLPEKKIYVLPTPYTDIYRYTNYRYKTEDIAEIYRYILEVLKEYFDATFIDVTDFGGFPYEMAIVSSDRLFLVGDGKLSSTGHMLSKFDELREAGLESKTWAILNRLDTKHNENEYENVKILRNHIKESHIIELPYDRKLKDEDKEMGISCSKSFSKPMKGFWKRVDEIPAAKRGFSWKK